jgi:hypothetical protein
MTKVSKQKVIFNNTCHTELNTEIHLISFLQEEQISWYNY